MFADFFIVCYLWLLLMMFVAEVLEWQDEQKRTTCCAGKSGGDAPLWRMFHPDFKGKVVVVACEDGEERFNLTIRDNFRVSDLVALKVELQQGKGGSAAVGASSVGVKPGDDKKRKGGAPVADGQKGLKLRRTRTAAITQPKPAVTTETREEPVFEFATPPSSPKASDVEVQKEDRRSPLIEVVTPPSVCAEDTTKKPAAQTIDDTLDSANNLIVPHDVDNQGVESRSLPLLRNQSLLLLSSHPVRLPRVRGMKISLPFSLVRLNWSFITARMR
ncbi:hypothetical protein Hdeb2414_s0005g00158611 [Helianthus debilis subsp. tardiflorus]